MAGTGADKYGMTIFKWLQRDAQTATQRYIEKDIPNGRWYKDTSTERVWMPLWIEETVQGDVVTIFEIGPSLKWNYETCPLTGYMKVFPDAPKLVMYLDVFEAQFELIANYTMASE